MLVSTRRTAAFHSTSFPRKLRHASKLLALAGLLTAGSLLTIHEAEAVRPRAEARHVTVEQRATKLIHNVAATPRLGSALARTAGTNIGAVVPPGRISSEVVKALQVAQQKVE